MFHLSFHPLYPLEISWPQLAYHIREYDWKMPLPTKTFTEHYHWYWHPNITKWCCRNNQSYTNPGNRDKCPPTLLPELATLPAELPHPRCTWCRPMSGILCQTMWYDSYYHVGCLPSPSPSYTIFVITSTYHTDGIFIKWTASHWVWIVSEYPGFVRSIQWRTV